MGLPQDCWNPAVSCNAFYELVLAITYHDIYHTVLVTQPAPIQCGRSLNEDMTTRRQKLLRALLECGYHTTVQLFFHLLSWMSKSKLLAIVWIPSLNLCQVFLQPLLESLQPGVQGPNSDHCPHTALTLLELLRRLSQFLLLVRSLNT